MTDPNLGQLVAQVYADSHARLQVGVVSGTARACVDGISQAGGPMRVSTREWFRIWRGEEFRRTSEMSIRNATDARREWMILTEPVSGAVIHFGTPARHAREQVIRDMAAHFDRERRRFLSNAYDSLLD